MSNEMFQFAITRIAAALMAVVVGYILLVALGVISATPPPACREYTGPLYGMDYNGEMWTHDGQLIGFAREEDTRIWNHPGCV